MDFWLVVLGGAVALVGSAAATVLQDHLADRRRRRERTEVAMTAVLDLVGQARAPFLTHGGWQDDGPEGSEFVGFTRDIERHLPFIEREDVRDEIRRAIKCLRGYFGAQHMGELTPYQSGQVAFQAVSDAAESVIHRKRLEPNQKLEAACEAIDEHYELMSGNS